jgi:hypothetical protein
MLELEKDGVIHDHVWRDFGYNRTLSLRESRKQCPDGWSIVLDADDHISGELPVGFWDTINDSITHMDVKLKTNNTTQRRSQIFSNRHAWHYCRRVHEYPALNRPSKIFNVPDTFCIVSTRDGARSQDPFKYFRDAVLLKMDLRDMPDDSRSIFYIAQSYRDAGAQEESRKYYKLRAEHKDVNQETYVSYLQLMHTTADLRKKYKYAWLATNVHKDRLDAPYYAMLASIERNKVNIETLSIGMVTKNRKVLNYHMFADQDIYTWKYDDVLSRVAMLQNEWRIAAEACARAKDVCPENKRGELNTRLAQCIRKLK